MDKDSPIDATEVKPHSIDAAWWWWWLRLKKNSALRLAFPLRLDFGSRRRETSQDEDI